MFDKPFATLFGCGLFIWIGAILLESTPAARLDVACAPVRWGGNIMGSIAALSDSQKLVEKVAVGTDDVDYGCQFTLWRLVYGKDYAKTLANKQPADRAAISRADNEILPPGGMLGADRRDEVIGTDRPTEAGHRVKLIDKMQQ